MERWQESGVLFSEEAFYFRPVSLLGNIESLSNRLRKLQNSGYHAVVFKALSRVLCISMPVLIYTILWLS
jgi:hypothetical protein